MTRSYGVGIAAGIALLGCNPAPDVLADASGEGDATGDDPTAGSDSTAGADSTVGADAGGTETSVPPDDPPGDRPPSRPDLDAARPCFDPGLYAYVDAAGSCDGRQPCFAAPQPAIEAATFGTTIWVHAGTYEPTTGQEHVVDSTAVLVCLRSVDGPASTIFDGKGIGTVVRGGYEGAVWLEGFTIRGAGPWGGDVLDGYGVAFGGWGELRGWVVGNVIEDNLTEGAVSFSTSTTPVDYEILVTDNVIRNNATSTPMSALRIELTGPDPEDGGLVRVQNNLVIDNEGWGLAFSQYLRFVDEPLGSLRVEVVNNTIVGNVEGLNAAVDGIAVHNNVIAGNDVDVNRLDQASETSVRANLFGMAGGFVGQGGNVSGDPGFVDPAAGNYALGPASPALDAGDPELAPPFDLAGRLRDSQHPDMGALESD